MYIMESVSQPSSPVYLSIIYLSIIHPSPSLTNEPPPQTTLLSVQINKKRSPVAVMVVGLAWSAAILVVCGPLSPHHDDYYRFGVVVG